MSERVEPTLRAAPFKLAGGRCEYCGMPEQFAAHRHEPDHVIAIQHGGETVLANLFSYRFRSARRRGIVRPADEQGRSMRSGLIADPSLH